MNTLDEIAREKKRDALFVTFNVQGKPSLDDFISNEKFDWQGCTRRKEVISFLEGNDIPYQPCFPPQRINGFCRYQGQIYIDMAYDESNPCYRKLARYLENIDGSMKIPGVGFWVYSLKMAMENAHHDEPDLF